MPASRARVFRWYAAQLPTGYYGMTRSTSALIRARLAFYGGFELVPPTAELMAGALDLHVLHGLAFYDALILQAAIVSGCQQLLSEDMQHGATFGGVRIVNPFVTP